MQDIPLECPQMVLPFDDHDRKIITAYYQAILAKIRTRRSIPRPTKAQIATLKLEEPLFQYALLDGPFEWSPPPILEEAPSEAEKPKIYPEVKFGLLTTADICKLAAGMLYNDLHLLMNVRGSASIKRDILNWMFAEDYEFADGSTVYAPLWRIPFTCQFCCVVEEIDYEMLCDVFASMLESAREFEAAAASKQAEAHTTLDDMATNHVAHPTVAQESVVLMQSQGTQAPMHLQ